MLSIVLGHLRLYIRAHVHARCAHTHTHTFISAQCGYIHFLFSPIFNCFKIKDFNTELDNYNKYLGCMSRKGLTIRKMQIGTKMRYWFTPMRIALIKNSDRSKCGCGEMGTFLHCWGECKMVQPLWTTVWQFHIVKLTQLPKDLAISLLGIDPRAVKTYISTKNLQMNIHSSPIQSSQRWKQTKCLPTN